MILTGFPTRAIVRLNRSGQKKKKMAKVKDILIIRRSCMTGRVVWVYHGASKGSAKWMYFRAHKEEIRRVCQWKKREEQRKQGILTLLNECLADIPVTAALTPQQTDAVRRLRAIANENVPCDSEFYCHIRAERIRRNRFRRQMRERRQKEKQQTCLTN